MTMAGPRVIQVIGEDFPVLKALAKKNKDGIPATAIYLQSAIALLFIFSSTFESVLVFSSFTLALSSFTTVFRGFSYYVGDNQTYLAPTKHFSIHYRH